jgi:hypothetical protein
MKQAVPISRGILLISHPPIQTPRLRILGSIQSSSDAAAAGARRAVFRSGNRTPGVRLTAERSRIVVKAQTGAFVGCHYFDGLSGEKRSFQQQNYE